MEMDKDRLVRQVSALIAAEPIPPGIKAILFGICEVGSRPQVYLSGSPEYDPDDDDWACLTDGSWLPKGRYLDLPSIAALPAADWEAVEQSCIDLVKSCREELAPLVGTAGGRPVAVGWDDGDLTAVFVAKQ